MKDLTAFLGKFKNIKSPKEEKEKIANLVAEFLGKEIKPDQISIVKNILSINTDNYFKTEIFLKKEKILEALNKNKFYIKDIR